MSPSSPALETLLRQAPDIRPPRSSRRAEFGPARQQLRVDLSGARLPRGAGAAAGGAPERRRIAGFRAVGIASLPARPERA